MNSWRFFHWQVLRYLGQHRLLAGLNVLSIAAGVAVYLAIQLANASARQAFASTIDLVAGKAQLELTAPGDDLPDAILPQVQKTAGVAAATPLVRGLVTLSQYPGEYLDILGVDVFSNTPFRTFELTNISSSDFDLAAWLGEPDAIAISEEFARAHGLHRGDSLLLQLNGREQPVRVGFVMKGTTAAGANFAAMDIGWAQELFGRRGHLSSIQVRLDRAENRAAVTERLRRFTPANVEVGAPARRSEQIDQMLGSFQLNLTAMSLVSLLVGAFLIFNTVSASVVRRRREIGILRALGVSRAQVTGIFLGEAGVSACVGILLGTIGGTLLARSLIETVSGTVSSLYVLISVRTVVHDKWIYLSAALLGLLSALAAAYFPARAAAQLAPVAALHPEIASENSNALPRWYGFFGFVASFLAFACSVVALRLRVASLSFAAALFCLLATSFFAPAIASAVAQLVQRLTPRRFLLPGLAALHFRRSLTRNSITIAALASAVAMALAVSVMIFSFRQTVTDWIGQTLVADIFLTPAANEIAGPTSFLPPAVLNYFAGLPGVRAVDTFRQIEIPFGQERVALAAIRADGPRTFSFASKHGAEAMQRFRQERCAIISESFARRHRLESSREIEVATPRGKIVLPIAGIFYDYTRDQGLVFVSAKTFADLFGDERVNSLGIYLAPHIDPDAVIAKFRQHFSARGEFAVYSNRALRQRAFEVFDQTFAVTYILRTIAVIVAVSGIFLSFTTLVIERSRTFGIMRALGTSARQLRHLILWEAVLVGSAASILGLAAGALLAIILTEVVNRAFFGWTIQLQWPWLSLAATPVWILAVSIAASLFPAFRASRLHLSEALRTE
ncbi:MAG: FtsX-like permease family protein [Verrucomicrobiota bacterium]